MTEELITPAQGRLLAEALGNVLVHAGIVRNVPMTGPELIHFADEFCRAPALSAPPAPVGGGPVTLAACPPGLFRFGDCLGFKTEYGHTAGKDIGGGKVEWAVTNHADAYVVESGEVFWGGAASLADRDALLVTPLEAAGVQCWNGSAGPGRCLSCGTTTDNHADDCACQPLSCEESEAFERAAGLSSPPLQGDQGFSPLQTPAAPCAPVDAAHDGSAPWSLGDSATYAPFGVTGRVVGFVDGWVMLQFRDNSTATCRPSSLIRDESPTQTTGAEPEGRSLPND